jgi:predicted PhzF superfamily epimerase YddE/YHI9
VRDALGAYLIERGLVAAGSTVDSVSEQGTRMGRQSFIQIRIATSGGRITEIPVGGRVVPVIEGRLRVPRATCMRARQLWRCMQLRRPRPKWP